MSSPLSILKTAGVKPESKQPEMACCMADLIGKAFSTRNLLHFAHWSTNSYAAHEALGGLYYDIIEKLDEIVEVYQGKFGLLNISSQPAVKMTKDIVKHVKEESEWMCEHKAAIAQGLSPVMNLLDELEAAYLKTIYKLENLK